MTLANQKNAIPENARIPKVFWESLALSGGLLVYVCIAVMIDPALPFSLSMLFGTFVWFIAAIIEIIIALCQFVMKKNHKRRKHFLIAAFLAATVPAFVLLGGIPHVYALGWRVYAARTVDLSKLQKWAEDEMRITPDGAYIDRDKFPLEFQPFINNFMAIFNVKKSENVDPPHILLIAGGGLSEMHWGLMIGDPNFKPTTKHYILQKWDTGTWFFFQ